MTGSWSYDGLYSSYEDENYLNDAELVQRDFKKFLKWAQTAFSSYEDAGEKLEYYISETERLNLPFRKLFVFARLHQSVDINDMGAAKTAEMLGRVQSDEAAIRAALILWLKGLENFEKILAQSSLLSEHSAFFKRLLKNADRTMSPHQEALAIELRTNGGTLWSRLRQKQTADLLVSIEPDGVRELVTIGSLNKLYNSDDMSLKQMAFTAEMDGYKSIEDVCAYAINGIKGEASSIARARGYENLLEESLDKNYRMSKKSLEALIRVMENTFEPLRDYLRLKAKLLGHEGCGLFQFELDRSVLKRKLAYTLDEASENVIESYKAFDSKMGLYVQNAFDNDWVDAFSHKGKRSGAFCIGIRPIKQFRIMSNFTGSFGSMNTFAHEMGHGIHNMILSSETSLNGVYPMTIAETASIFGERLLKAFMMEKGTDTEKMYALENALDGEVRKIMDIYCRFKLEHEIVSRRDNGMLTANEINEMSRDILCDVFKDTLAPEFINPYVWIIKPHFYMPETNYYNIPYACGLMLALTLYGMSKEDDSFNEKYKELLRKTGKMSVEEFAEALGGNSESEEFWNIGRKEILRDIEEFKAVFN